MGSDAGYAKYAQIDAVNWSSLKVLRESAKAYQHRLGRPFEPSSAMLMGTAIHTAVIEPERFGDVHPIFTGKKRQGKAWTAFKEEHPSADILTEAEALNALAAARSVQAHPIAGPLMRGGEREQTITWTDPETGLACKCRVDLVANGLRELKTTGDLSPNRFAAQAARLGYHGQIAFYEDGLREAGHVITTEPRLVCVQSVEPWDVVVYSVGDDVVDQGRRLYQRLLRELRDCREANAWPGRAEDHEMTFALPSWAVDEDDEDPGPLLMGGVAVGF